MRDKPLDTNKSHRIPKRVKDDEAAKKSLYDVYSTRRVTNVKYYSKTKKKADNNVEQGLFRIYKDLHQCNSQKENFATWASKVLMNAKQGFSQDQ